MALDWNVIERGNDDFPQKFDFYAQGEDRDKLLRILELPNVGRSPNPERLALFLAMANEFERCYSAYRIGTGGRAFFLGATGKHRSMRESAYAAAEAMLDKGIGPADVLWRLAQPGAMDWMQSSMKVVPWTLLCSLKIIDMTSRRPKNGKRAAGAPKAAVTHSFSAPLDRASDNLRSLLETQFGKEAVAAVAKDDGDLYIKVEARAKELRANPRIFLPAATKEMVKWYMKNHLT